LRLLQDVAVQPPRLPKADAAIQELPKLRGVEYRVAATQVTRIEHRGEGDRAPQARASLSWDDADVVDAGDAQAAGGEMERAVRDDRAIPPCHEAPHATR
jgi:hypothetical protein